jgi:hypothetical protein
MAKNITSIDFAVNSGAHQNIVLSKQDPLQETYQTQLKQLDGHYDAIINVAGGWVGGNLQSPGEYHECESYFLELLNGLESMINASLYSSVVSSKIAASHLKELTQTSVLTLI